MSGKKGPKNLKPDTLTVTAGREPAHFYGFVNPPVAHGSTVIYPTVAELRNENARYSYGRRGGPAHETLEMAIAAIEGGHGCRITPSGKAAVALAVFAAVKAGDHILIADNVYLPTRRFVDAILTRLGIEVTYFDPQMGAGIRQIMRPNTSLVVFESPGSLTFEVVDIPATTAAAHAGGALVIMDNTWASPYFCKPISHGVDLSVQAATKYVVGHSDAMLGAVTATEALWPSVNSVFSELGLCAGPDDAYLGQRGLRTMNVRLDRHMRSGLEMAEWLSARPEVAKVLHPALPSHPGHDLWKRDFSGASGLFSIILKPCPIEASDAMLNRLNLFGMGFSWGGYESLIVPFDPRKYRTATTWNETGQALRLHIGLEDTDDLKDDLAHGFAIMNRAAQ